MKELTTQEFDERLQKQVRQARAALDKGGVDYVVQVCAEILKGHPGAYEVRSLLWDALRTAFVGESTRSNWLQNKSKGMQFKMATRSLLKKDPLEMVHYCDGLLREKQVHPQLFVGLDAAARLLEWPETRVMACQALVDLQPDKSSSRLALAENLIQVKRPQESIELLEWVLAREPSNSDAQTLLKNASVAETLQRGNWEDTGTTFHSKKHS